MAGLSSHMRKDMSSMCSEEYLTTIYKKGGAERWVRTGDIAKYLNISPASATEAIQKLYKEGYVEYLSYKGVKLTQKGVEVASCVARKEREVREALVKIGISEGEADEIACLIEHRISREAVDKLKQFVENCIQRQRW
ncbi:MAG: metal-dependent transcriptional regulator [Caldisphaeraceae archaeon]|nr:metal-dependent transcriptional regulator [Caldisphaeraceae archaeon]